MLLKQNPLCLATAGLITVALSLTACGDNEAAQGPQGGFAMPVDIQEVKTMDVPVYSSLSGRTSAIRTAEVRPQVSGVIIKRLFTEGAIVNKGDQLYQIDPALYEAQLDSAKAELARQQANLNTAQLRYDRYAKLIKTKAISEQDFDDAQATYRSAEAAVLVAKANVKTAQINLNYTKVYAPISGTIGRSNFTEGALVTASQSQALATITQLDPIYADLPQSVADHIALVANIKNGSFAPNKNGNQVEILFDNGQVYEQKGSLEFSEVMVDESTGSINVRVKIPNPDNMLLPGMYVRANINEGVQKNALLVPQEAVMRQTNGKSIVYVVNGQNTVEQRVIDFNSEINGNYIIKSGVKLGDKVITSNLQKIGPGAPLTPIAPETKK